ncbi:hypothetical protein BBJ28_00013975 [Nothophytophthora sp. Chile5]|nr:hypothetical protein BBJ28_00013975 [Nothophytophthora sp. Chile5]
MRRGRGADARENDGGAFFRLPWVLVVEFLDLREAINLLNASRYLRWDRVLTTTALEKTRYAQHFHQQCAADWWHLSPVWRPAAATAGTINGERLSDGVDSDWDEDEDAHNEGSEIWADCHVRAAAGAAGGELTYWKDTVRETPQWQHVPLLSIIDFMVSKLLPQSYISFKYAAAVYTARPVIIRLHPPATATNTVHSVGGACASVCNGSADLKRTGDATEKDAARSISESLVAQNGKLASLFGLHWENMHVLPSTGKICCAVCELYADEVEKYQAKVAEMVREWRAAVSVELPGWKAQGLHQMEIDRRTYEMREEMIPYSGFYTSNIARRHGDIIIRHICSYWTSLDHLNIKTLDYHDASQLVAALTSDIRKQCQHFSKIKQAMVDAFPHVARTRYELGETESPAPTNGLQDEPVTELVAGVSPSGFLCGMLFIEKGS